MGIVFAANRAKWMVLLVIKLHVHHKLYVDIYIFEYFSYLGKAQPQCIRTSEGPL